MTKRSARVGAAAVALGLSLAAQQGAAVASADTPDQDPGPATAGPAAADPQDSPSPTKTRANRAAGRTGGHGPRPAAATTGQDAATTTTGDSRASASAGNTAPVRHRPGNDGPLSSAAEGSAVPGAAVATGPVAGPQPAAAAGGPPVPAGAGSASAGTGRTSINPVLKPASAIPAGAPNPVATASVAIARFFDSAAGWMSQFPRNPVTDFLQGAMLLVRRGVLGLMAAIGSGPSTGQTSSAEPYLSEQELRGYLLGLALQRYGSLFGQTVPQYGYGWKWLDDTLVQVVAPGERGGPTSDTNTQVDGVDEADFVETDGTWIYVSRNGALTILDAGSNISSQTPLSGYVVGQFLSGDRLTVVTQTGGGWYGPYVKMAPGYFWNWNPQTTVTVYDVSDRTAPVMAGQTVFDGAYQDARAVDGMVYLVLDRSVNLPAPLYTDIPVSSDSSVAGDGPSIVAYRTYETWDAYVARVGDQITTLSLPHAYSVDADGNLTDLGVIAGGGDVVRSGSADQQSMVTVVSVDSHDPGPSGFASGVAAFVGSNGTTVYMTPDALYLATAQDTYTNSGSSTDTRIDRFTIDGADIGWQATGLVTGTLINQFAMDEQNGYLRVATHNWSSQWAGGTWATVNDSGVYVLDTAGDTLDVVGSVTGLAPGEQLYAVRFAGDKAYLVTFVRTDPLFVVDLSDPTAPAVQGELVIPGYSDYLQTVADGLLLGIGQEREPGTWNSRLHISLFDVRDPSNPTLIDRQFLDESAQWSASEAEWDHHALLYSPEDGLLVVPMGASGYDPQTGNYRYEQTLQVLRVTVDGLEVLGAIRTDSPVLRTVRIGDVLYAVSEDHVTAYSLTDFSVIGGAPLGPAGPVEAYAAI